MDETIWYLLAFLPLLAVWVGSVVDAVRRPDRSVARRLGWLAALVLIPFVGLAAYVVMRPPRRPATTLGTGAGTRAEKLVAAAERRQRGELDEVGFRAELVALGVSGSIGPAGE